MNQNVKTWKFALQSWPPSRPPEEPSTFPTQPNFRPWSTVIAPDFILGTCLFLFSLIALYQEDPRSSYPTNGVRSHSLHTSRLSPVLPPYVVRGTLLLPGSLLCGPTSHPPLSCSRKCCVLLHPRICGSQNLVLLFMPVHLLERLSYTQPCPLLTSKPIPPCWAQGSSVPTGKRFYPTPLLPLKAAATSLAYSQCWCSERVGQAEDD